MSKIVFCGALLSYLAFLIRFAWQAVAWFRATDRTFLYPRFRGRTSPPVCASTGLDIFFFRRIFSSGKLLWLGSWTFHVSLFFVALRHARYFFPTLPDCLIFIQPVGVFFGYLLPVSLLFLIVLRSMRKKYRYVSSYNHVISGMLLLISASGIVMRNFFRPDLVTVKQFSLGIVSLSPAALPDSPIFLLHGIAFVVLLPYLPTHLLAAPFVTLEANRRNEELKDIIHETEE